MGSIKCSCIERKIVPVVLFLIMGCFDGLILEVHGVTTRKDGGGSRRENLNTNLIWWTPFTGLFAEKKSCGDVECYVTEDRSVLTPSSGFNSAILFYGSDIKPEDLPIKRYYSQIWALLHEESPKNNPILCHSNTLKLFNFTSTFSRFSTEPITLQYLKSLDLLVGRKHVVLNKRKNAFLREGLAPIIYIQSDCDTPSERDTFVKLLKQHIKVDSYGRCLNNRELPEQLQGGVANMDHPDLAALIGRYKFAVAIENSACDDYITEKLWRPLTVGTVPLYWGSPSVKDWLPNNNSIINIRDYSSPLHLAQHLKLLLQNDTLYEGYLDHKLKGEINNDLLKKSMEKRIWGVGNDPDKINFIEHFECSVCRALHRQKTERHKMQADARHYQCGEPESVMQSLAQGKRNDSEAFQEVGKPSPKKYSLWLEEWHRAKLEAKKLSMLIQSGKYSPKTYHQDILNFLIESGHFKKFPPLTHEEL